MEKIKSKENDMINILRFIFAICVVAIHTNFLEDISIYAYGFLRNIILLLAVPFFFITSGYFIGKKMNGNNDKLNIKKFLKSLLNHYIFWGLFYLIMYICIYIYQGEKEKAISLIIKHLVFLPNGAIWFVPALMISVITLYIIRNDKKQQQLMMAISMTLTIFTQFILFLCLFSDSDILMNIQKFMNLINSGIYRTYCLGYVFVAIGFYIAKFNKEKTQSDSNYMLIILAGIIINIICTLLQINSKLKFTDIQIELFLGTILMVYGIFKLAISCKLNLNIDTKKLRKISSTIFYTHYAVLSVFKIIYEHIFDINNSIILFSTTTFFTICVALILNKINIKLINKII